MMIYKWLLLITALQTVIIEGVAGYFLPNVTKPLRNKGLRITCSSQNDIQFYNYNLNPVLLGGCNLELQLCSPPYYGGNEQNPVYRLAANSNAAWLEIISVDRTRDQGLWFCGNEAFNLTVYSSPSGISFAPLLPPSADLAEASVTLECKTNSCCYPEPTLIAWYYQTTSGLALLNVGTTRRRNSTGNCTQQEQIYFSSLELSRGTTFPGNIPVITTLLCGITHPVFDVINFSGNSNNVTFAVSLTHVNITGTTDVTQGIESTFTCITSISRPPATVMWFIGNTTVTVGIQNINMTDANGLPYVESRLTFDPNGIIHHGKEIYCQAITPFDVVTSAKLTLYVRVSLTNVNITGTSNVTQGIESTFTCRTSISRPTATTLWFIGNTTVTTGIQNINRTDFSGLSYVESMLTFDPNGTIHHGKEIYCQAITFFDIVYSANLTLYVKVYVTSITISPAESIITFLEGYEKTLTCTSSLARPQPIIRWWLDGAINTNGFTDKTTASGSMQSVTSELFLTLNKTYQNKQIYCDAWVDGQHIPVNSSILTISVWYAPDVVVHLSGSTMTNATIVLTCMPLGEPPQYTFHQWVHKVGETEIRKLTGNNTANTSILTLSNISIEDMGTYMCTVDNSITGLDGQINQTGHTGIFVHGPPFIQNKDIVFTGVSNKSARMEIPFYSNPPSRTITFYRGSNTVEITNTSDTLIFLSSSLNNMTFYGKEVFINGQVAVLHFRTVKATDFGEYTVVLFNNIGSTSRTVLLSSGEPEKPENFHITDIQEKQVTLQWLSGYHRGFDQTFVVQISMDNITWINASFISTGKKEGWISTTITGLKSNTAYYFRLYSFNVNGRGDFADVHFATRTLKEYASSFDIGASLGIGFGGFFLGVIGTISVIIIIRKRVIATPKHSSARETDTSTEMHTYTNTRVNSSPAPSHYEELHQEKVETNVYDQI